MVVGVFPALQACGGGSGGASSADERGETGWSIDEAVVLFERRDSSGNGLFALDRATGQEVRLTPADSPNWAGRVSPDGTRLLFVSTRDGDYEIYHAPFPAPGSTVGGASAVRVTDHPDYDVVGAWSPTGDSLAFMSTRGFELGGEAGPFPGHVYVVAADGGGLRQVTREPLTSSLGPTDWSPDGRWLTIARDVEGQIDVFLLDVANGDERRVTSHPSSEYAATFSRDGRRLAFHADDGRGSRIVVTALDGSDRRALTPEDEIAYSPTWSPDDEWLLYTRRGASEVEEYDAVAVRVSDGAVEPLVATRADERVAGWAPTRER